MSPIFTEQETGFGAFSNVFLRMLQKRKFDFAFFYTTICFLFSFPLKAWAANLTLILEDIFPGKKSPFLTKILYLTFTAVLGSEPDRTRIALCRDSAFSCSAFRTYCKKLQNLKSTSYHKRHIKCWKNILKVTLS